MFVAMAVFLKLTDMVNTSPRVTIYQSYLICRCEVFGGSARENRNSDYIQLVFIILRQNLYIYFWCVYLYLLDI